MPAICFKHPILAISLAVCIFSAARADILVVEGAAVRRYSDSGTFLSTFAHGLAIPLGITEAKGSIFIGQPGSGEIHKYDADGKDMGAVLAGHPEWQPAGLAWNDGRLYAASAPYKGVASYVPDSLEEDGDSNTPEAQLGIGELPDGGCGLCSAGKRGGVYYTTSDEATGKGVLGYWSGRKGEPAETIQTFPEGSHPRGIAVDGDTIYVALMGPGNVVKISPDGKAEDWLTGLAMPVGLAIKGGSLYVSQHSDRTVKAYNLSDKSAQTIINARSNPQYFAFVPPEATDGIKAGRSVWLGDQDRKDVPIARVRADLTSAQLPVMSWDTEGGNRAKLNLLLAPVTLSARIGTKETALSGTGKLQGENEAVFQLSAPDAGITWSVHVKDGGIRMTFTGSGKGLQELGGLKLTFPFDPRATATGPVGGEWMEDGKLRLPTLLYAPDLGAMRVSSPGQPEVLCRWEGSRGRVGCWATLTIEIPPLRENVATTLLFEPYHLPQPEGLADANRWKAARRGWMNLLQTSTQRPAEAHYLPCPAGVWANNIISDPVSATLFWLADHVMLMPDLAPDISAKSLLRRTVELYLNGGVSPEGVVHYVWRDGATMDANPALLIGAWGYVEASGDMEWFKRNAERLEYISQYMEQRDVDGDGLIESPASGNRNTRAFGDSAWDCISSGHKNAYVNALAYRAWRGLAQLEERAGRTDKARHFNDLADRLKKVYRETFYNPETGWLGWWRSADGELHDVWSDVPTSIAVSYGLLMPEDGGAMLDRHWAELKKTGFKRLEVGLPLNLRPIPPSLMLQGYGGKKEDGSDTFHKYLNGGACVSNTSFWLLANYIAGRRDRADEVLDAMLERQRRGVFPNGGAFQNGIIDRAGAGAEFFDWEGNTTGYEGHLVYSWAWMQALFARDGVYQHKVLQPLK